MRLAAEAQVKAEPPLWVHPSEKSRFRAGSALACLEQNLFRCARSPTREASRKSASTC